MHPLIRSLPAIAALLLTAPAVAGLNSAARFDMYWSPNSPVLQADCAPVNTLYVTLNREAGLTFKGAIVQIEWFFGTQAPTRHDPTGAPGCVNYLQSTFPSSSDCSALNRGPTQVIEETSISEEWGGYVRLQWLNTGTSTGCESGPIAEIQIESEMCSPCGALVLWQVALAFDGTEWDTCATGPQLVLGQGPAFPVEPTTWGAIKDLMRR